MLSSLILMLSQRSKNPKIANVFKYIWTIFITIACFSNLSFSFIEIVSFMLTTVCIYLANRFGSKVNTLLSVFSILIYSIFVDIMCYFAMPAWHAGQSLIQYVLNGIIFNSKYVLFNALIMATVIMYSKPIKKLSKNLATHLGMISLLFKTKSHN